MRNLPGKRGPAVVRVRHRRLDQALDFDVAVCGGTLGLLLALSLQVCCIYVHACMGTHPALSKVCIVSDHHVLTRPLAAAAGA